MALKALQNVLVLERQVQASLFNLFQKSTETPSQTLSAGLATSLAPPSVMSTENDNPVTLVPVDVSGFYMVTGPQEVTFYATTDKPIIPVGAGWSGIGFSGILGQTQVSNVSLVSGPGYNWSFTLQSDTDQNVQGVQQSTGAILYPPGQILYKSAMTQSPIYGYYITELNVVSFFFSVPPPSQLRPGWIVSGLPTFNMPLRITSYSQNLAYVNPVIAAQTVATLEPVDGSLPPNNPTPIYVNGIPSMVQEPLWTSKFIPGRFTNYVSPSRTISNVQVQINSNVHVGNYAEQRTLNTDVAWSQDVRGRLFPQSKYTEVKNKGFSSGSVLALQAVGPQETFILSDDMTRSEWNPEFKRYSNFVMYQKVYPFPPPNPVYQGQSVQIELRPTELGHLLSNMYLSVNLPPLPSGASYTPNDR